MKTYHLLLIIFTLSCSCSLEAQVKKEPAPKRELGTVYKDSFPEPKRVEFTLGPKVPKKAYLVNEKSFSLDEVYGKEVISSITPKDGLTPRRFQELKFDEKGNLWLTDVNGDLTKYNGQGYKEFIWPDSNFKPYEVLLDKNGHMWYLQYRFNNDSVVLKISVFDGIRFRDIDGLHVVANKNEPGFYISMYKGANNSIWVIKSDEQKLMKYDGEKVIASYNMNDVTKANIRDIVDFGEDELLMFDNSNQNIILLKNGKFETIDLDSLTPDTKTYNIVAKSSSDFYALTSSGLYRIKDKKASLIDKDRNSLLLDSNNFLWIYSSDGIQKSKNNITIDYGSPSDLVNSRSIDLKLDNNKDTWIKGDNYVGKFNNSIKTYGNIFDNANSSFIIREIYQTKSSDFYFGTFDNGLIHYDGATARNYDITKNQNIKSGGNNIISIAEDLDGNIWFTSTDAKLTKFDGQFFQSYTLKGNFAEINHVDTKGNIWLSENNRNQQIEILYKFDGEHFTQIASTTELGNNIMSVYEDGKGVIWIGTGQALWKYNQDVFSKYTTEDGLPNNFINTVTGDKDGNLWLGTDNGLSIFDGDTFTNYGKAEGITDKSVGTIIQDTMRNKFWIKGQLSNDLSLVNFQPKTKELHVENYSSLLGFPIPSYRELFLDKEGTVWLLSMTETGIVRFDYKTLKENSKAFPISINEIRINGESLVWSQLNDTYVKDSLISKTEMNSRFGKEKTIDELKQLKQNYGSVSYDSLVPYDFIPLGLKLPYSANSLSLEFSAIDPFLAKSTKYQYFLEGFDKAWSPLSKNTIANYGNLYEGNYTLKIKALNPYGLWSEKDYKFVILPPWYRTWWAYVIYGVLLLLLLKQVHNYQKKRTIKKERAKAQERELEQAKAIEKAYNDLKATQQQLIQSEKMASLGELTAGIAHEIQNPLNFVNNFSEVSNEIIEEIKEERKKKKDERDEVLEDELLEDIANNLEKINHHGKRADSIVKGMLQHSRSTDSTKEPTDINKLADEYLRLAYHGLRAKDKSFNAELVTDFDESLQKINVVPQDVGRVILNLVTNAFYACTERLALSEAEVSRSANQNKNEIKSQDYKPTVTVRTKKIKDNILIEVTDNGDGIPDNIKEKIFQPFFTTKPTGQGTGLGLSMSYDIITKGHGGELKVETKEGEGTTFCILIPTN